MNITDERWRDQAACQTVATAIFWPPQLPTKHQVQRDRMAALRLERRRSMAPQELTAAELAELDRLHREQRDPYIRARVVCGTCPVRLACLEYALAHEPDEGMWGGLDGTERRRLKRRLSRQRRRVTTGQVDAVAS